jgi:Na+-transporting NADH:ubiquinone oxidoreductase subunit C
MSMIKDLLALPNDSKKKTLFVALATCLVCSVLVSAAAVALKPMQEENKAFDKKRNILEIAGLMEPGKSVDELFKQIETRIVDVNTGEYVTDVDVDAYDQRKASSDPAQSEAVPKQYDVASIKRRAKYASVYLVMDGENVKSYILPIKGYGLWSTLYGFLALESDAKTVVGLGYYEHAETPGLGGEVDNPNWKAKWIGKEVYDDNGQVKIDVVKGAVDPASADAVHQVDGLSGATLTSRGVSNMLHYWLSDQGFAPYLNKVRATGGN